MKKLKILILISVVLCMLMGCQQENGLELTPEAGAAVAAATEIWGSGSVQAVGMAGLSCAGWGRGRPKNKEMTHHFPPRGSLFGVAPF